MKTLSATVLLLLFSKIFFGTAPYYSLNTKGGVTDMHYENGKLYVAEDNGYIQIFNTVNRKLVRNYVFPKIKDFTGENISPKVYSLDKINGKDLLVSVSQGQHGFSNVFLIKSGKFIPVLSGQKDKLMIKKVKFLSENKIILGLLSNEIILYDIKNKRKIYRKQISPYTFSDIVLSKDKTKLVTADESGIIHVLNTLTGKTIKELSGNNVDNVYKIDYKENKIVCGGQDRRLSVYDLKTNKSYYIESSFLIYCVGLSPSGKYAAYSCNENNDVKVIETNTKTGIDVLKGHESTLTDILFVTETTLFTSAEENKVYFWKIKTN